MHARTTTMSIAEFLEIVGEHGDFDGYTAIRQRLVNQTRGGRTEREFLALQVEIEMSAFLRDVSSPDGRSRIHVRVLNDKARGKRRLN